MLNVTYWVATILPERCSWYFSGLSIVKERVVAGNVTPSETAWHIIRALRTTDWMKEFSLTKTFLAEWRDEAPRRVDDPVDSWTLQSILGLHA